MKPLDQVDRAAFRWLREEAAVPTFQLLAGDEPVARLQWPKPHGSLALAETAEGVSTVKRNGFLSPHVTVRDPDGQEVARMDLHLSGSRLVTTRGSGYTLRRQGILVTAWQLIDARGRPVLHLEPVSEHGRLAGGVVAVTEFGTPDPDLARLLLLTWYFVVQAWFEEEAGAATVAGLVATG